MDRRVSIIEIMALKVPDDPRDFRSQVKDRFYHVFDEYFRVHGDKSKERRQPWEKICNDLRVFTNTEFQGGTRESFVSQRDTFKAAISGGNGANEIFLLCLYWMYVSPDEADQFRREREQTEGLVRSEAIFRRLCNQAAESLFEEFWSTPIEAHISKTYRHTARHRDFPPNHSESETEHTSRISGKKSADDDSPNSRRSQHAPSTPHQTETAPFKWPPHVSEEDAFSANAYEGVWLNPHNHFSLPLSGRDEEWSLLDEFCAHERDFLIGAVIAPSGAGKTRLVSQWMRGYMVKYQDNGWDAGFVDSRDAEPWYEEHWTPTKNTLIVIDYTYNYDQVIGALLDRFKDRAPHKIRLLVLDHVLPDKLHEDIFWKGGIESQGFVDSDPGLFPQRFRIHLEPEQDQSVLLRDIIAFAADPRSKIKRYNRDSPEVIKAAEALMRIGTDQQADQPEDQVRRRDSVRHPLFAALVGQALGENPEEEFDNWSRRDLITHYFERRQRIPWGHDKRNKYSKSLGPWVGCYVCAATLLRGAPVRHLRDRLPQKIKKKLAAKRRLSRIADISNRIVSSEDKHTLKPFEPDILGEAFLLKFLKDFGGNDEVLYSLVEMIGSFRSPKQGEKVATAFLETVQRLVRNLINDSQELEAVEDSWGSLLELLNPEVFPSNSLTRQAVSIALVDMITQCRRSGLDALAFQISDKIDIDDLGNTSSTVLWLDGAKATIHYYDWLVFADVTENYIEDTLYQILVAINNKSSNKWSPLILASYEGCLNTVKFVHARFEDDINDSVHDGSTALIAASLGGKLQVVEWLIEHGADPNIRRNADGMTALMVAALNNQLYSAQKLLICDNIDIDKKDNSSNTALTISILNGYFDIAGLLINQGANVNISDYNQWTPLMIACQLGDACLVSLLLDNGADIAHSNEDGWTALIVAASNDRDDIVDLILTKNKDGINDQTKIGWAALTFASQYGNLGVAKVLLKHKAKVDCRNIDGNTPLIFACYNGHNNIVHLLRKNSANLNMCNRDRWTPLMAAVQGNHKEIAKYLIEYDANINNVSRNSGTALDLAHQNGRDDIAKMIRECGGLKEEEIPSPVK